MISKTFCIMPFIHQRVSIDGNMAPCCRFPKITEEFDFSKFNIPEKRFEDVFYSPEYKQLRQLMLEGKPVSGCHQCYRDEAAGAKSLRISQNMKFESILQSAAENPKMQFLEVAVGNFCNLKCIMCGVGFSYRWAEDEKALAQAGYTNRYVNTNSAANPLVDFDLDVPREHLEQLTDLKVVGGEPLLQKKLIDFLERVVDYGIAKNVALEIYTNTTHWPPERAIKAMGAFKSVQFLFSIDGFGAHDEYIRYPTRWNDVQKNVEKWLKVPEQYPSIYISCNFTVNILNALYYVEMAEWWHRTTKGTPYEKHLETTFVNYPSNLCVALLPDPIKSVIAERLEKYRDEHKDRQYVKFNVKRILHNLYLKQESNLSETFNYLEHLDRIRKTSFAQSFPELYEMLKPYRDAWVAEKASSPLADSPA